MSSPARSRRDWLADLAVFLFAVSFGLVLVDQSPGAPSDALLAADVVFGSIACLALWWRRRWPVGVALALAVPAAFSDMASGAVLIALFTVAVHRPRPVVAAVAAVHVAAMFLFLVARPDPEAPFLLLVVILLPLFAAVLAWGMFIRARHQLVESLRERARWVETEQRLLVEQARHLERTRIAREMHDVLAHRISLLSMHAGALEFRPDAPAEEIAKAAGVIRDSAHQALEDLREVIGVLRAGPDGDLTQRPQPTLADLPALVEESRLAGVRVRTEYRVLDLGTVPTAIGRNAYRIIQEGLTNARKHAPGAGVDVVVDGETGKGLSVEVRSRPPVGEARPSTIPGCATGLVGLVERATLAGGRLEHGRTADGDFLLSAWLPWAA
jgi:signal transduction histidine kinase